MRSVWQITVRGKWVTARTLCATTAFFYDLLGRPQNLDLHRLPAERPLELPDLGVGLPQLAGRDHVFTGLHRRRRARLRESFPGADDTWVDIQLATELRDRLLPAQDSLHRLPLELRAEHPPAICLPPMFAHGASRRILRPQGEQPKGGALHASNRIPARFNRSRTKGTCCSRRNLRSGEIGTRPRSRWTRGRRRRTSDIPTVTAAQ